MTDFSAYWTNARDLGLSLDRVPTENYTSQEVFERERDLIFKREWLGVARVEEIPNPGDYILAEVPPLKTSVIIARGSDGQIRAFYNSCSHRGVALVCQKQGNASAFRCPYHAWTYGNDGSLRAVPAEQYFPQIDKAQHGLAPVHVDVWNGFLFVNFAPTPAKSLAEFLGGLGDLYHDMPFADYPFYIELKETIPANWKLLVNGFTEGYHVPILHKKTLLDQVVTRENPLSNYFDIRTFGPHTTGTVERNFDWTPSPTSPVMNFVIQQMLPTSVPDKEKHAAGVGIASHPGLNRVKIPNFGTENITVFPNFDLQPLANGYLWFVFWPVSANEMQVRVRVYSEHAPKTLRQEFAAGNTLAFTRDVLAEDLAMAQLQQAGLESGAKEFLFFGEHEPLLRHFAKTIDEYLNGPGPEHHAAAAE